MSKNSIFTGTRIENRDMYYHALSKGAWIAYKKKCYTPTEFITRLGAQEINIGHLQIEKPLSVPARGARGYNMITSDKPKEEIIEALKRLNVFTDKVRLHAPVVITEYDV